MQNYRDEALDILVRALIHIDSSEEAYAFLDDLCTVKELHDLSQRLETAILLSEGKNYQQIAEKAGTSTATISRVSRCLQYGDGGYRTVIEKLKNEGAINDNK